MTENISIMVRSWLGWRPRLDWLFAGRCAGCYRRLQPSWWGPVLLCAGCLEQLPPLPPGTCPRCALPPGTCPGVSCALPDSLGQVAAATPYGGLARRLMFRFKYGGARELARPLGRLVAGATPPGPPRIVVPVPLHPERLAERGYNQAGLLAAEVARELGLPGRELLCRTRLTDAQHGLGAAGRRANLRGAFAPVPGIKLPRRVLLVDDILTTGTTVAECALALKDGGVEVVDVVAFARATRRPVELGNAIDGNEADMSRGQDRGMRPGPPGGGSKC